jgi:hypothetical protein
MVNFFFLDKNPKLNAQYYCDKHVNKIMIEICQLLSNVLHNNTNLKPPYKKTTNIPITLAPYKWANYSKGNYIYLLNLAEALFNEYKFRYDKNEHKTEKVIEWLKNNIPNHFKHKKRTKLFYTKNIDLFHKYIKDDVDCFRYIYVNYKCKNDKWTKREKPKWFDIYNKKSNSEKEFYKKKLLENVKIKLPELYKKDKDIKVKRFHSFLRIIYDNMFGEKWLNYIKKYKNMYNDKEPLINQLSFVHLHEAYKISKELFNKNKLIKLNEKSLKWRGKK